MLRSGCARVPRSLSLRVAFFGGLLSLALAAAPRAVRAQTVNLFPADYAQQWTRVAFRPRTP
jgi:hypothetical protein